MTKHDFIAETLKAYKKNDLNKRQVTEVIESAFKVMEKTIQKEKRFSYPKFGVFNLKKRKARIWAHPQTAKLVHIDSRNTVSFKPSVALRSSLNKNGRVSSSKRRPKDFQLLTASQTDPSLIKTQLV